MAVPSLSMEPNLQWQTPPERPSSPLTPRPRRRTGTSWLPAALIGSAIVIAAGLIAGALIFKDKGATTTTAAKPSTCQAWSQTWVTLKAIPALPNGWTWQTPNIDSLILAQNVPVAKALDGFESQIATDPADVAKAATDYLAARRAQMQSLQDRSYTAQDGAAVDTTLSRLNDLCGISAGGRPI